MQTPGLRIRIAGTSSWLLPGFFHRAGSASWVRPEPVVRLGSPACPELVERFECSQPPGEMGRPAVSQANLYSIGSCHWPAFKDKRDLRTPLDLCMKGAFLLFSLSTALNPVDTLIQGSDLGTLPSHRGRTDSPLFLPSPEASYLTQPPPLPNLGPSSQGCPFLHRALVGFGKCWLCQFLPKT